MRKTWIQNQLPGQKRLPADSPAGSAALLLHLLPTWFLLLIRSLTFLTHFGSGPLHNGWDLPDAAGPWGGLATKDLPGDGGESEELGSGSQPRGESGAGTKRRMSRGRLHPSGFGMSTLVQVAPWSTGGLKQIQPSDHCSVFCLHNMGCSTIIIFWKSHHITGR